MTSERKEIYCRFESEKYGAGVHETACSSIEDAASTFSEDEDCISAFEITLDAKGHATSLRDVTEEVFAVLRAQIEDDVFSKCPHPHLEDEFRTFQEEQEREAEAEREHERIESAMIHI